MGGLKEFRTLKTTGGPKMAFCVCMFTSLLVVATKSVAQVTPPLIVFGDSTVDTGNNNYINTTDDFRANYPPYGQRYFGKPSGRFSNGRVFVDFICQFAGRPLLSPYLEPGVDHSKGVNFASGGSGVLDETNEGLVIPLKRQLQNFADYQDSLNEKWGASLAKKYFSDAIYVISQGNNDYMAGYFAKPELQQKYAPQEFVALVVTEIVKACEFLRSRGAWKIVVVGVGPMGCIPAVRALHPAQECFDQGTQLAIGHNMALEQAVRHWAAQHPDVTLLTAEYLSFMTERQNNPTAYGGRTTDKPGGICPGYTNAAGACCGQTAPCGRTDPTTGAEYTLCENDGEFVYWDAFHGSESIHEGWIKEIWDGPSTIKMISPMNLRSLFEVSSSHDEQLVELETFAGGSVRTLDQIDN